MKAIVATKYGSPDVLNLEETEKPAPKNDEVLVKVRAASVNAGDWHLLRADPFLTRLAFGLLRPKYKVLGADIAGRIEAVGGNVTQFQPGDEVFGDLSRDGFGGFAEYVCEAGKITPVIDRTYPLSEVPKAIRYLEEGHAEGKVVIIV